MSHTIFGTAHLGICRCICATNPDGCPLHQKPEPVAHDVSFTTEGETVIATLTPTTLTGEHLQTANDQLLAVARMQRAQIDAPDRTVCQHTGEIATLTKQRDDARDELSNMVDLTIQVGKLGDYLKHALADCDDERERADDWAEKYDAAQCRMDEMASEIRELRGEK